jgi:hypothetical protein
MPDWITQTLSTTPAFLWIYVGVGVPWALALLPRMDRRKPVHVLAAAFVFGPAWLTLWMFILGTFGAQTQTPLLRLDTVLVGTVVIAAVGVGVWVWRDGYQVSGIRRVQSAKYKVQSAGNEEFGTQNPELRTENPELRTRHSLAFDERLLVALIVIALVVRWFVIAYWPHIAYDVLWVYGYQGRLYALLGYIPNSIDYYPQFLSLQHTFGQLVYGAINDHAARAVVPFINLASTLAVYVLGDKLFGRRVAIYAAAIWTLYHHVGEWSRMGDLEIALTTTFTLAAAYFVSAWWGVRHEVSGIRYQIDASTEYTVQSTGETVPTSGFDVRRVNASELRTQNFEARTENSELRTEPSLLVTRHSLPVTDSYALLAGLILGVALWTKPTAGAFVWGVGLCLFWILGSKFSVLSSQFSALHTKPSLPNSELRTENSALVTHYSSLVTAFLPHFRIALLTGLAAAPLGGIWYIRNILLGHNAVDFPPAFWLTQAMRSGAEFGWVFLGLTLSVAFAAFNLHKLTFDFDTRLRSQTLVRYSVIGIALAILLALSSILESRRLTLFNGVVLVFALLFTALILCYLSRGQRETQPHAPERQAASQVLSRLCGFESGMLCLLALPYFVTWFWSYSYHYRLSFAIVPLLLMPTAIVAAGWSAQWWAQAQSGWKRRLLRTGYALSLLLLALPGIIIPLYDGATGWDGLWSGELADDLAKQRSGNQALLNVVDGIQAYVDMHGQPPVVIAPGVQTLPFFFPLADIRIKDAPTRLDDLDGAHYFIDSHPQGSSVYQNVAHIDNQVLGALARQDIVRRAWGMDDGIFRYDVYELALERRWQRPQPNGTETEDVIFGGFVRYLGEDLGTLDLWEGRPVYLTLYWEVLAETDIDYMIFLHLRAPDGAIVQTWDAPVALNDSTTPPRYYSTRVWQPGEFIADVRLVRLEVPDVPLASGYSVVVGLYDLVTGERVPVVVDGQADGDGYVVDDRFNVITNPDAGSQFSLWLTYSLSRINNS